MKSLILNTFVLAGLLLASLYPLASAQNPPPAAPAAAPNCPHNIDAARCPFCDPSRVERLGMCKEHNVAEALCVKCKPYLEAAFIAAGDWCKEHGSPESQCALCTPAITSSASDRAQSAGAELRWQREPSLGCSTSSTIATLASADIVRAVGLEYAEIQPASLTRTIERNSELAYNANRYARLSSRATGVVAEVRKDLGAAVEKGEVLAIIDSTDLGAAKSDLLQSLETMKLWETSAARERALVNKGVGVEREAFEAENKAAESKIAVNRARQKLRNFGLSKEQIAAVESNNDTDSLLELVAAFDGMIVERAAVMGEVVEPGKPILAVADTTTMWALVDLTEADLAAVQTGQQATLSLDGLPGKTFTGKLTWISTQIDPKTRTLKARVELENKIGVLRANMFGRVSIKAGDNRQALTIPKTAVQWEGCCNIAFVRTGETTFQPTRLVLGYDTGDRYEIADGLKSGDRVVTTNSYLLKNEILKNSVGAGCCEIDHLKK